MWSVHEVSKVRMSAVGNAAVMSVRCGGGGLMSHIAHVEWVIRDGMLTRASLDGDTLG
jgi:hypothetical protein